MGRCEQQRIVPGMCGSVGGHLQASRLKTAPDQLSHLSQDEVKPSDYGSCSRIDKTGGKKWGKQLAPGRGVEPVIGPGRNISTDEMGTRDKRRGTTYSWRNRNGSVVNISDKLLRNASSRAPMPYMG
jgi:hypothetical protein